MLAVRFLCVALWIEGTQKRLSVQVDTAASPAVRCLSCIKEFSASKATCDLLKLVASTVESLGVINISFHVHEKPG
jgi:hypothetical protein